MKKVILYSIILAAFFIDFDMAASFAQETEEVQLSVIIPKVSKHGSLPKTGQTVSYRAGDDGDLEKGCPLTGSDRFVVGAGSQAGTVTDNVTGLMWELKTSNTDTSIHCRKDVYTWFNAFSVFIETLNNSGFAGYSDWRLPNVWELRSIVNYGGTVSNSSQLVYDTYFPYTVWKEMTSSSSYVNPAYWVSTTSPEDSYNTPSFTFSTNVAALYGKRNTTPTWPGDGVCVMAVRGGRK